jgi:5-methylcytosine-specific restriction endonuclease McrA
MPDPPNNGPRSDENGDPSHFEDVVDGLEIEGSEQAARWELGLDKLGQIRRPFDVRDGKPYTARHPCLKCGTTEARLVKRGNQNTVRCARCNRLLYNAPKVETGERPRTVKTLRTGIKPSQQARILDRDAGRCVLCGSYDELTIGHLLSIEDGLRLGATAAELNSDANLAAMCEACNLGLPHGPSSINPRTYAVIMWRLAQMEMLRRYGE